MTTAESKPSLDFIRQRIADDLASDRTGGRVVLRFPPEPNGFLHIGHAKAICISFGIAEDVNAGAFGEAHAGKARCHLRFDDTNPIKEEQQFIDAIKRDIHWLGFDWGEHEYHASDYFDQLYEWACALIRKGLAYVDEQSAEEVRESRGTLTTPGKESPHRHRPPEESLDLFQRMKNGEFPNGSKVLRAKIDMAAPNVNLRDPVLYRILHARHPRTGDSWCVYPMYDWAHGQSDWIEGVTHSLCSLEFEDHRPLYEWFIATLESIGCASPNADYRPQQTEFNRLNLTYTVTSKRRLRALVEEGHVVGWDDPRMPTLGGLRRRGCPPEAIRAFCATAGLSKRNQTIDIALLEHHVREELNRIAPRVMGVQRPLKVVITNYPENQSEELEAQNIPGDPAAGTHTVPFSRDLYIEQEDFMEEPPPKYYRLSPGREVRLRYAYFITCTDVIKDEAGNIREVHCTYDPATRGGDAPDGRKVKATLHWVSAKHAVDAEVRHYEPIFTKEDPNDVPDDGDWRDLINPNSMNVIAEAKIEPSVKNAQPGDRYQFERVGYFCVDPDSKPGRIVFNRTVTLKDTWTRIQKREGA